MEPGWDNSRRTLVPISTVKRLSLYLRLVEELAHTGQMTVSSSQLARGLSLTDAQVRKDLGYFGQLGRPGVGYAIADLAEKLREILGTNRISHVAVVGVGSLGRALLRYRGFETKGFHIAAAFDVSVSKVGRRFNGVVIHHLDDLPMVARRDEILLAILAVPADQAQSAAEIMCDSGIRGILNFAPVRLVVPEHVAVVPVDLAVQLEQLNFLIKSPLRAPRRRRT